MYKPNFYSNLQTVKPKKTNVKEEFYHKTSLYIENNFKSTELITQSTMIPRNFLFHKTCLIYDFLYSQKNPKIADINFIIFCFFAVYKTFYPNNFVLSPNILSNDTEKYYAECLIQKLEKNIPTSFNHYSSSPLLSTIQCIQENIIITSYLTSYDYLYLLFGTCNLPTTNADVPVFQTALNLAEEILVLHLALNYYQVEDQKSQAMAAFIYALSKISPQIIQFNVPDRLLTACDQVIKKFLPSVSFTETEANDIETKLGIKVPINHNESFQLSSASREQLINALQSIYNTDILIQKMLVTSQSPQFRK